jgi:hypothetical protein
MIERAAEERAACRKAILFFVPYMF